MKTPELYFKVLEQELGTEEAYFSKNQGWSWNLYFKIKVKNPATNINNNQSPS